MLKSCNKTWDCLYTNPVHSNMWGVHPNGCEKWSHGMWKENIRTSICIIYTKEVKLYQYMIYQLTNILYNFWKYTYIRVHTQIHFWRRSVFRMFGVHCFKCLHSLSEGEITLLFSFLVWFIKKNFVGAIQRRVLFIILMMIKPYVL